MLSVGVNLAPREAPADSKWFAVHARSRHEVKAAAELERAGVTTFLPLVSEVHRWSDRHKLVEVPLFPCYLFVCIPWESRVRSVVQLASGVLGFVGTNGGTPVAEAEIEAIRTVIACNIPFMRCDLQKGQRVRVRGGMLAGIEGVLLSNPSQKRLLLAINGINQTLSISVQDCELDAA
jgi:transcription antitermination factor NusG